MAENRLPESKAELVERIEASWAGLNDLINSIPHEKLSVSGPEGWSVKDHMAHLATWERMSIAAVKGESEWEASGVDRWEGDWDENRFNNALYQKWRESSAAEAKAYLEEAHEQIMELLAHMDDVTLQADMPNEPGRPNVDKIAGNTYMHFDEHRAWIEEWSAGYSGAFTAFY